MLRNAVLQGCRLIGRSYPFLRTTRVIHNPLTKWASSHLTNEVAIETKLGFKMFAFPNEVIGRQIYLTGSWDPHILFLLLALSRDAKVVVDVGANIGFFALAMANGSKATVHAFEPQPRLAEMARRSSTEARLANVVVHEVALSDEEGEVRLSIDPANLGGSRLGAPGWEHQIPIKTVVGSDYLTGLGVDTIDLMKVDVEGHEPQVFRGLGPMLASRKIKAILFEDCHDKTGAATEIVEQHGYKLLTVGKGLRHPVIGADLKASGFEDVLAVAPEAWDEVTAKLRQWMR